MLVNFSPFLRRPSGGTAAEGLTATARGGGGGREESPTTTTTGSSSFSHAPPGPPPPVPLTSTDLALTSAAVSPAAPAAAVGAAGTTPNGLPPRTTTTTTMHEQRDEEQVHQDVRRLMNRLQNILPFLMLLALRYVYGHALGLSFAFAYTLLLVKLNKHFSAQVSLKDDQDPKVLWAVIGTSLLGIVSACFLRAHVQRDDEDDGDTSSNVVVFFLIQLPPKAPDMEEVLWAIFVTDVCVRLFFIVLKAMVALLPPSPCRLLRLPTAFHWVLLSSYLKGSHHHKNVEDIGGSSSNSSSSSSGGMVHFSHRRQRSSLEAMSLLGIATPLGLSTSSQLDTSTRTTTESRRERPMSTTSMYTRKRRVYYLLEAVSLLGRSLLTIPAWLRYYQADHVYGDVFVLFYLTAKCMVLSRHCKSVLSILVTLCQANTLEYGMPASKEEMQEAGATECAVCYEHLRLDRSVVLPCSHIFCECVSEWLERERSCPLCRSPVKANFDDGSQGQSRTGSTSAWPCIL